MQALVFNIHYLDYYTTLSLVASTFALALIYQIGKEAIKKMFAPKRGRKAK